MKAAHSSPVEVRNRKTSESILVHPGQVAPQVDTVASSALKVVPKWSDRQIVSKRHHKLSKGSHREGKVKFF